VRDGMLILIPPEFEGKLAASVYRTDWSRELSRYNANHTSDATQFRLRVRPSR